MDVHQFGLTLRLPFTATILEVTDQLFFLRIDRDHRNAALDATLCLGVDVLELCVAIWMLNAFNGLVRCLETVAMLAEQFGHGLVASLNALCEQLRRQRMRALARPPQRRLRITTGDWIDQLFERRPHLGMDDLERPLPSAASNLDDVIRSRSRANLVPSLPNGAARHPRCPRYCGNAPVSHCVRLRARPESTRSLIHGRLQQAPLLANELLRVHPERRSFWSDPVDPLNALSHRESIDKAIRAP